MKATQGATRECDRARASFRNPHDGVASGACPDNPQTEFQGEWKGVSVGDLGRAEGGKEKGTIAGGVEKREGTATREIDPAL